MLIGIPKEVKDHEYRVGATPSTVKAFIAHGHTVLVETRAGTSIGFTDEMYQAVGASVVETKEEVYEAEMIIKVKEPQPIEYPLIKEGQVLFCYLHLAPDPDQTNALLESGCVAIAYETIEDEQGRLPLLTPMSEVAGRVSIQAGATALQMANGGRGVLLGGVTGTKPGKVLVVGGGVVGTEAAKMAMGLGADVTVFDRNISRLRELEMTFGSRLKTMYSTEEALSEEIKDADLVVGSVLIPGKMAPKVITREMVRSMKDGSVFCDVAIDQGGCSETSKPTTHTSPTYIEEGVVHYCVTNMPGSCAYTATLALTNATLNYALKLANEGYRKALSEDPLLMLGLNVCQGKVTYEPVANDLGLEYADPRWILLEEALV
ncbi:MAG: Alanine dehydrogenase [Chlamydiia bacterium]|nr:Alanine dehydrogenase [Chlamydiia bacterium]